MSTKSRPPGSGGARRDLPSIETLLASAESEAGLRSVPRDLLLAWLRESLGLARAAIVESERAPKAKSPAEGRDGWIRWILDRVAELEQDRERQSLRRVVNATGVFLHTNLGRAPLSAASQAALASTAGGYSNLELDLESGRRRSRLQPIRELLPLVTGAEAGFAVHNNAAAVFLGLAALARGRRVLVSRGELVEIGGGFRLPDIMEASGAILVEVGTTNRTRLADYERAMTPEVGLILKVHPSNFRLLGFTEEATVAELAPLAHSREVPLFVDLGSGALSQHGALSFDEPRVQDALAAGADLVAVSGDKLLGGPQAGLLCGGRELVRRLEEHPLARVVRLDKTVLAALEATLRAYLSPDTLAQSVPLLGLLSRSDADLAQLSEQIAAQLRASLGAAFRVEPVETRAEIGGGSLPGLTVPSRAIALSHAQQSPDRLAHAFRTVQPSVVGRIEDGRFLLDLRAVLDGEESLLETAAREVSRRFGAAG